MEAIYSYKLLVCTYQTKWCHNSEYYNMKLSLVLYFYFHIKVLLYLVKTTEQKNVTKDKLNLIWLKADLGDGN